MAPEIFNSFSWIQALISIGTVLISALGFLWKLSKYQEKVDRLEKDSSDISKDLKQCEKSIATLQGSMSSIQRLLDISSGIYQSKSPLQLTALGIKIINDSGFSSIFRDKRNDLAERLRKKNPKTKYDVQEKSMELMLELTNDPIFDPMKPIVYRNGFDFSQILRAGSLLLRDYYLSLHPSITE